MNAPLSLKERIEAQKAARIASGERAPNQQITTADINLRGTGITKREAAKNTREYERQAAKAVKADQSLFAHSAEDEFQKGVEATIEAMRESQRKGDIVLDDSQFRAVAGIIHNKVSVLIGAAGTGKTTVTKVVIEELQKRLGTVKPSAAHFITVTVDNLQMRMLEADAIRKCLIPAPIETKLDETVSIAGAAYTGRAAQQFRRAVPEGWQKNISTIHSLLGYAPVMEEYTAIDKITGMEYLSERRVFRPSFDASCKLPYQMYILDEASMIPIPLFNELIDAIHDTSRILLIGDIHQLPPVYGKSVLGYAMRKWPVFELTTIHRQAAGNAIISNAHNVLKGKALVNAANFHLIGNGLTPKTRSPDGSGELQKYVLQVVKKLHGMGRYNPYTDAIIVPQNKGMVGQVDLNQHLVTMFNPEVKEDGIIVNKRINIHTGTGHTFFAVRDKVMITQNINNTEPPISNGMIGIVETININGKYDRKRAQVEFGSDDEDESPLDLDLDNFANAMDKSMGGSDEKKDKENDEASDQRQSSHGMTIKFENGQTYSASTAGDYRKVQHGYAATCHKSQGGEYPSIIILCHSVNNKMLKREWLYTAVTRARENVYIICNNRGLDTALRNESIKGNTIAEKIKSYLIETKVDEDGGFSIDKEKFPMLGEPEEM